MKRLLMRGRSTIFALVAVAALALVAAAGAGGRESHFGPFASSSPDSGTCGNDWAQDTFERSFKIKDNGDGTFSVREDFKQGAFVTLLGPSPGACETDSRHGLLITAGIEGKFHGYLEGTVTSATFNQAAVCTSIPVFGCTGTAFLTSAFGPAGPATFTCFTGVGDCSFAFEYSAGDQGLAYHHWKNASLDKGGNSGDIATS